MLSITTDNAKNLIKAVELLSDECGGNDEIELDSQYDEEIDILEEDIILSSSDWTIQSIRCAVSCAAHTI